VRFSNRYLSRYIVSLSAASCVLALAACGGAKQLSANQLNNPQTEYTPPAMNGANTNTGNLFSFGMGNRHPQAGASSVAVNAYLWRASLDTLSFMPLASADPFAGVIITDWYSPSATPNERFKATAYVLSNVLSANALKVALFRQVQQGGQWVSAPVDPATVNGLEDRILARAAQLKAAGSMNG
jgi:hypothetical protein